ncbi:hypothetical protein [Streptobacillus canis]|uniref:hypothetical protein n=1 Tax=Streptobacillus canis TaxID=2678686 RepID=UPI0012E11BDB|nr:hypothetical protein [Streptobacillus canis]
MTNNNINLENNKKAKYKHLNYADRVIISHLLKQAKIKDLTKYVSNPTKEHKKYS